MALSIRPASVTIEDNASFGTWTGFVFTINTVVGAGFLSLPWAYNNGGWLFCLLLQVTFALLGYLLAVMMLEILSRVETIARLREEGQSLPCISMKQLFGREHYPVVEALIPRIQKPEITHRRFDISEVMRVLFGEKCGVCRFSVFYSLVLFIQFSGALVAYTSIFSTSFASNVPLGPAPTCDMYSDGDFDGECRWKYLCFLALFGVCMVYFTIVGYKEQLWMQICMTIMRFLVMTTVIVACLVDIGANRHNEKDTYNPAPMPAPISLQRIGRALPIIMFACMYQTQMPNIIEHIKDKKRNVPRVAFLTAVTSFVFYSLLGLVVSAAIEDVPSQSTLSFRNYSAGYSSKERPWWTYLIEYLVVLFPALDVFSSFPLNSVPLGDNLLTLAFGTVRPHLVPKWGFYGCKLVACLPALLIAVVEFNLGEVLEWSGLLGFFLVPFMISVSHVAARKVLSMESEYDVKYVPEVRLR